ncbi:hypothetical protein C8R47DRAFT_292300 [Mycena vitilis]|nr:hypothetical protein C8R47DRAFT_292300 [Mycena vitilis]
MIEQIHLLCTIAGHPERHETIGFRSGVYRGYEFIADLQSAHDAYCHCDARIERVYKVEKEFPPEWDEEKPQVLETETSVVDESDSMHAHFPWPPRKTLVSILCDAAPPLSPISSDPTSSIGSKRSRQSFSDDSSDRSGSEQKRPRTRSPSPIPSSRKHSFDLSLPHGRFDFPSSLMSPQVAFVDKTQLIAGLPARFTRLLLRPPRFGKTALLSTLAHYYDIREAETFPQDFGSLAVVTTHPPDTEPHNQHLCLMFNFSQIARPCDVEEFKMNLSSTISVVLRGFVRKYASELQIPDPTGYLETVPQNTLLGSVLNLVRSRDLTIFAGVDNYDAPIRKGLFPHPDSPAPLHGLATQSQLEALMEAHFWKPMCDASDVVHKIFVTGTFPLNLPSLQSCSLLDHVAPHGLYPCGFTEKEAQDFSQMVMDDSLDVAELRRSCGQYTFSHPTSSTEPVFHPDQLIARIYDTITGGDSNDASSFVHLPYTFAHLPAETDIAGAVATAGLIDLIATGAIETNTPADALVQLDGTTVTWSALYYLGAVTYDLDLPGTLRLGNIAVLSMIHSEIDKIFSARYDLHEAFYQIWKKGDADVLVELLTEVLRDLAPRYFGKTHEPDLRGVFELVLGNQLAGEPRCIMGPLELFSTTGVSRVKMRDPTDVKRLCHWELRTLTLNGLWRATNLNDDKPTAEALETLHKELLGDEEEQLLERPYAVWSPDHGAMETVLVRSFLQTEPDTPFFLAVGGARVLMRS